MDQAKGGRLSPNGQTLEPVAWLLTGPDASGEVCLEAGGKSIPLGPLDRVRTKIEWYLWHFDRGGLIDLFHGLPWHLEEEENGRFTFVSGNEVEDDIALGPWETASASLESWVTAHKPE